MSLRTFHLLFIVICVAATDMFGAWAVWQHTQQPQGALLIFGALSFLVGFGLIAYAIWFVRKEERAQLP